MTTPLRHPGKDHRPVERCVGFGMPFDDGYLLVRCTVCKADAGVPCRYRGGGSHRPRRDRAYGHTRREAYRLFEKLEGEALRRDPAGPLWSFQGTPHRCGVLGPHVLTDCTAVEKLSTDTQNVD